jgi:hypothetical protein
MPIETMRPSASIARPSAASAVPLAIAALLAFALHLVGGAMLGRSHASPVDAELGAQDKEATCRFELKIPEPLLPYD